MSQCPKCQTVYDDNPAFCGTCGKPMPGAETHVTPEADPFIGIVVDHRYRIIDLIGRGGMGAVYRVEHVKMGKVMAIKILQGELSSDSKVAKRFKLEAETVSLLSHINTVSIFDFGNYEGMMYLVMEYIDGQDLAELLRDEGPLPFERVAGIMIQVCSALNEAHAKGVVHRDLKPGNILVGQRDEQFDFVKVVDFGLARLRDMNTRTRITEQGSIVGTPYYMAPEHIKGEGVDARSDIYSLGAVMHRLLTGNVPFSADTPMGVISKHLTEEVRPMSKEYPDLAIPKIADKIVQRAMSKDPAKRHQTADAMRTALADAVESFSPGSSFRRFSSASRPPPKPEDRDDITKDRKQALKNRKNAVATRSVMSKSVVIGSREVSIGTKSDFINFQQRLKRKRKTKIAFAILFFVAAVAGLVSFIVTSNRDDSNPRLETEPNDTPVRADKLTDGIALAGFISGPQPKGDIDWYRLPGPGTVPWTLEVDISGIPGLDVAMQLIEPNGAAPIAVANEAGQGKAERIRATRVNKPEIYLMVQEVRAPGVPPGSFGASAYKLFYRSIAQYHAESEPNDTISTSTPVKLGTVVHGAIGPGDVIDWYCHPAGIQVKTIKITGMPGIDAALTLKMGPKTDQIPVNHYGMGQGEAVELPKGLGPTCAGVGQHLSADGGQTVPVKGDYQIVFQ